VGNEDVDQIEDIEIALEIDGRNVTTEKYREADGPNAWGVPPMPQSILHQDEASAFLCKLLDIMCSVQYE
jgi:hypothetical protein